MKETLEEAAENKFGKVNPTLGKSDYRMGYESGLIAGAKWQQEQDKNKYSEEEVLKLVDMLFHKYSSDFRVSAKIDTKDWIEQFKKK
jgi:hypothetical protein